jgi:hypothetical protein
LHTMPTITGHTCPLLCPCTSNVEQTIVKWSAYHYLTDHRLLSNSASCTSHVLQSHDQMVLLETNQSVRQDDAVTELYHYPAKISPCTPINRRALYPNVAVLTRPAYRSHSVAG